MNEQYPSNGKNFSVEYPGDGEMKKRLNHRDINSLIVTLENMKCSGPMRLERRKKNGQLRWVAEHFTITRKHEIHRVPHPENGEHVGRRGRKATDQGWALIAGLPKESFIKRQRTYQDSRAF